MFTSETLIDDVMEIKGIPPLERFVLIVLGRHVDQDGYFQFKQEILIEAELSINDFTELLNSLTQKGFILGVASTLWRFNPRFFKDLHPMASPYWAHYGFNPPEAAQRKTKGAA